MTSYVEQKLCQPKNRDFAPQTAPNERLTRPTAGFMPLLVHVHPWAGARAEIAMKHVIVGPDAVTPAKAHPAHLIEAVQIVGAYMDRAIMVGDSVIDTGAARAAGTH